MNNRILLILIIIAAALLRLYHLGTDSLWLDEGYSENMAQMPLVDMVKLVIDEDNHPPLYYALLHGWVSMFGNSEFALRGLSVLFGCLSVFMCYQLCALFAPRRTALWAALLLAISTFHIEFSQEARVYAMMVFFTLLNMYFFVQLSESKRLAISIAYLISAFLLIHCHVYALFIIVAQNAHVFTILFLQRRAASRPLTLRKWIILQAIVVLSFVPWLLVLLRQYSRVRQGYWMLEPPFVDLLATLARYAGGYNRLSILLIITLSLLALNAVFVIRARRLAIRAENRDIKILFAYWLILPIIIPFVISRLSTPIFQIKSTIAASLPLFLLAALGISKITNRRLQAIVISILIILSALNFRHFHNHSYKEQWRQLATHIEAQAQPNDLILFVANYCDKDVYSYYARRTDIIRYPFPSPQVCDVTPENLQTLEPLIAQHPRVWLVLSHDASHDPQHLVRQTLTANYPTVQHRPFTGIDLYLFQ
ncbi:MAG: glycosyltransferase family 39 protein [Sedimentisphaerales bacterium]|nr:glycosyltransferase family 39 protein [Sedimentisphaerales bacterium]